MEQPLKPLKWQDDSLQKNLSDGYTPMRARDGSYLHGPTWKSRITRIRIFLKKCSFGNYSFEAKLYHQHLKVLISLVESPNLRSLSPSHTSQDMKQALLTKISNIRFGEPITSLLSAPNRQPAGHHPPTHRWLCSKSKSPPWFCRWKVNRQAKSPWVFPKLGVFPPKWMVYKWKPY